MHVSILAGLLLVSSAYSEHEARVAAPFHHLVRVGVIGAHLWSRTKDCTAHQRCKIFARLLLSGVGLTVLHSRLKERSACHATPRLGASLRSREDTFLALSSRSH